MHSYMIGGWESTIGANMSRCAPEVLTIGHSNHSLEAFTGLLIQHRVKVVADVRSAPYSRFNPQFNRESLTVALGSCEIEYRYFGGELGGRPNDPACYENGRVCYERVAKTPSFRRGIAELLGAAKNNRVALMCAERVPLDCHRTLLVCPALDARSVGIHHILADGTLEDHDRTIDRLLRRHDLSPDGDMFATREACIALAFRRHADQIAYGVRPRRKREIRR